MTASPAVAYNGTKAANYANYWWNSRNLSYPNYNGDDCTNFVSQAIHAGGFSMVGVGKSPSNTSYWWAVSPLAPGPSNSYSWSAVQDFQTFMLDYYPGGYFEGTARGTATNYYTPNSVVTGDPLLYNWGTGLGYSHATIQVGIGYDPSHPNGQEWYGNYVDAHDTDHYHAFWSLYPYNAAHRNTTTIYFLHISASNT